MILSSYLVAAIEEIENESSPLSDMEKYMQLGDALYKHSVSKLSELKRTNKPREERKEDELMQMQLWRYYKEMGQILARKQRAIKESGKSEEDWKNNLGAWARQHKPSLGQIQTDIRPLTDEKKN